MTTKENGGKAAGCPHLEASTSNLKRFALGLEWGKKIKRGEVKRDDEEEDENGDSMFRDRQNDAKRRKLLPHPSCMICLSSLHRPFICLQCAMPACFFSHVESRRDCMRQHLKQSRHVIGFDLYEGTLYCSTCDDVVYSPEFQEVTLQKRAKATKSTGQRMTSESTTQGDRKNEGLSICRAPRGLYNLGASCFMNVILQSFVQNPLLRNYFLSDRHHAALCPARENCLACELDKLFTEFFTEKPQVAPFAPTNFLFCIYLARESTEVSTGAGEHDAHELFITALNNVHSALMAVGREPSTRSSRLPMYPHGDQAHGLTASRSGTNSNSSEDGDQADVFNFSSDIVCPCVVHRTFAGVLQSDVTCQRCGWTSSTHDPFLDLSLDIRPNRARDMSSSAFDLDHPDNSKKKNKKQKEKEDKEKKERLARENSGVDDEQGQTLVDCMRRYCSMEKLASSDYTCTQCGQGSQAVKQLSLCRLPPVLCFQLKRFEHNHNSNNNVGVKLETRVKFPLIFDLREYCTNAQKEDQALPHVDPESYLYDLFTVVVHEGKLNTGHYYCYFRWREAWYLANDDALRPAKLHDVLSCRAYQLCYLRRGLQNIRAGT
ncbi:hypothetical protein CBS101457_005290 [Exobasidium rhododendri]|nr:hypothetical protein CBS101457_005290 [Exobasidium rhododendri]